MRPCDSVLASAFLTGTRTQPLTPTMAIRTLIPMDMAMATVTPIMVESESAVIGAATAAVTMVDAATTADAATMVAADTVAAARYVAVADSTVVADSTAVVVMAAAIGNLRKQRMRVRPSD